MLYDSFGHIVEIPDSTDQPSVFAFKELKRRVAKVLNAEDDREVLETAGDGIRWAIAYSEISRRFQFRTAEATKVVQTLNSGEIALPRLFFGVRMVKLLYTLNSITGDLQVDDVAGTIPYIPYDRYRSLGDAYGDIPLYWSANNTFVEKKIYLYPKASQNSVDDWTLQIVHDQPIILPSSDGDSIAAPEDFSQLLVEGGKYYVLFERKRDDPIGYKHQWGIFEQMLARYGAHEIKRHAQKHGAMRIGEPK